MIELADPLFLLALPVPLVLMRLLVLTSPRHRALFVPERIGAEMVAVASEDRKSAVTGWIGQWLPAAIWVLLVLALCGPRSLAPIPAMKVSGRDMAVVLDLSGSMVRDDFFLDGRTVTRLEAVTTTGAAFARRRGGDRLALIVFGSEAYYAAPFSFDVEAVARRIENATIGISGRATNISDGLGLALKRFADSAADTKVVILLSDGVNNAGATNPRGVAELAAEMGVRVHTIALGPKDLTTAEEGERGVVDAETLRSIAQISGGQSYRVRSTEDLVRVAEDLDRLEATDADGLAAEIYTEYWVWPAAMAFVLGLFLVVREADQ